MAAPAAGNRRDHLVFAHANGFPGAVYGGLLEDWAGDFEVSAIDRFGHAPEYPVARGWAGLTRQLVDHIDSRVDPQARLWLAGHSLGGYVSVLAAAALGDRVRGVVLLDSPLIGGFSAQLVRCGRRLGLDHYVLPLRQTRRRRREWPDLEAAQAHFAARGAFARWDARALRQYVEQGTVARVDGGRVLAFDPDIELAIYRTLPTGNVVAAARAASAPLGFIGGTGSRELRQVGLRATRVATGGRIAWVQGSHLFPMERPRETAQAVREMVLAMDAPAARAA